ncbi:MAG: class I SAM-dependent methyltransferase [Candidatus Woesearchaeota archaeon]|nr:class I SAM-dependent methyltransferase [Candidatus Woesearchaeota archaeon]
MPKWEYIFKHHGKVFENPAEGIDKFLKLMKKEKVKRVLDLGCGTGRHAVLFAKKGFEAYGMDNSEEALRQTREWLRKEGLNAELKKSSCFAKFPHKDSYFDAVVSTQVINHNSVDRIRYCISEIERVLRPGGIVFITLTKVKSNKYREKIKKVAPRTYIPLTGREKGVLHYIYNKELLRKDFSRFKILGLVEDSQQHLCLTGKKKAD